LGRNKDRSDFLSGKTTKGKLSPTGQTNFEINRGQDFIGRLPPEKEKTNPFVKIATWCALGIIALMLLISYIPTDRSRNSKRSVDTVSSKSSNKKGLPGKMRGAGKQKNILFIGNNLTGNVIPEEVCRMLNSGKSSGYKCQRSIKGGFHLTHHQDNLSDRILGTGWDVVVLQEHSSMLSKNAKHPWTKAHQKSLRNIASRLSSNKPVFAYMTPWSEKYLTANPGSSESIKQNLTRHSSRAAAAIYKNSDMKATVLPVAQALVQGLQLYSKEELFSSKNYLSNTGSCLAAWTIAITLVGEEKTGRNCSLVQRPEPNLFNIAKIAASGIPGPVLDP